MRIHGNRQLKTLPGLTTRPTTARVREALFQIWQRDIINCTWLDICAGNGTMSTEALCRGAKLVVGIDNSPLACEIIRENWQKVIKPGQDFRILRGNVEKILPTLTGQKFERIYFDPPYQSQLYQPVISAIAQYQLLTPTGELAVEHDPQRPDICVPGLEIYRKKIYGKSAISFYLPVEFKQ